MNYRGDYMAADAYAVGDTVRTMDGLYVCITAVAAGAGTATPASPQWEKVAGAGGGGSAGGNYLPLTGGTVDGQTVLKNGKSKVNVDSGIIKLEHDEGPAYPYIEMTAQGTSTNGPLVVGGVLSISNGYRDVPATPSDGQVWESGNKVYVQSGGKTVEIKDAPPSPVPLPHAVLPTYDDGSYSNGRATVENGKLLISQTDKNGTNWADVFLALPVGTVLTWQSDTSNTAQEHIITGAPTLGPTAAAGEKVIEIPVAASTGLISAGVAGTFSWPGGPPDTGHVLTATAMGMAWQAPTAGPAELPATRPSWTLTTNNSGAVQGIAGVFYVENGGTRMQVNAVDSAGVDHTDEFHLIAPDTLDIYVDGVKHTVTVGSDTNGGHRDWALSGSDTPAGRYLDLYFDAALPDTVRNAKVIELGGGWATKPISGASAGSVLTLDASSQPAWKPLPDAPSGLPDVPHPAIFGQWRRAADTNVASPKAPGECTVELHGGGTQVAVITFHNTDLSGRVWTRQEIQAALPDDGVSHAWTYEFGGTEYHVEAPMGQWMNDGANSTFALQTTSPFTDPPTAKPTAIPAPGTVLTLTVGVGGDGKVLTVVGGKPAWQAPAGGAPPEVAVSATEPTEPSVLLWVKIPGGTP
jgi:hypothetical protein